MKKVCQAGSSIRHSGGQEQADHRPVARVGGVQHGQVDLRAVPASAHVARGLVAICSPVDSQTFGWGPLLDERWRRVVEQRREPVKIGHQRAPSPMDSLIVFTAEHHGPTVPPVDDDFAAIAKVRPGIPMIRLQPRTNDGPHSR
ncbi:VapC toxin family PIN domain ribonuclease [Streptomyces mirabilis]|uniref:VapC toxin family PIN domain ribonuclease n=1 Tax=Streptomyces mirabilis TaxID=68239 RepID=UPI001BAFF114|nr:VapC toxin family PIN domain ribonuclease [Streptomyces mirabilis]QUW80212.1 VapC toxin family PIN domain ribonuclease [Streptomyces mirabilis]